ncbi:MAG: translocation/assembly module TamB domain-containing protein [Sphingobacteriaceae bacterium]
MSLLFSLQFKPVQTYFAQRIAGYLSRELHTKVQIAGLHVKPFRSIELDGFLLEDLEHDTLVYTQKVDVKISKFSLKKRQLFIAELGIKKGRIYFKKYKNKQTNLSFLIRYFSSSDTTKSRPFDVRLSNIKLSDIAFKYRNYGVDKKTKSVNFSDIDLKDLNGEFLHLDTRNHLAQAEIRNLRFHEKSGFWLKNLSTFATIDSNKMEFKKLKLQTAKTNIGPYCIMKFKNFDDFDHFNHQVYMLGTFNKSRVLASDVAYFAPELSSLKLDLKLHGTVKGTVSHLQAKNLRLEPSKGTVLKGNFDIKGLPLIKNTLFTFTLQELKTSKKEYDQLLRNITGNTRNDLPVEIAQLGNFSYTGTFAGLSNDFKLQGTLQTALGKVAIKNFAFKRNAKHEPLYEASVQTEQFDLGKLLNKGELGFVNFDGEVRGKGFQLAQLSTQLNLNIGYIDYNHYRYQQVKVNGQVDRRIFNGSIGINDAYVQLDFLGKMDFNPDLPVFNFESKIRNANLLALHFIKDSLTLSADLQTNFNGNTIENIQGSISANAISLKTPSKTHRIDSIEVVANGLGNNRAIELHSDLAEASLKGKYDLMTLPSYFKSVLKKYIPSMRTKIVPFKSQHFDVNVQLKKFEPIGVFMPKLRIPEGAILNGKFDSDSSISTINGYVKMLQYDGVKANNLIVDETTEDKQMNIFLTSDRIDLGDSLFVKNVNIATILRADSLSLNVKLSDKDAINQLDLNGLVEFSTDSMAKLSILPSDLIINREVWKIQDKVLFRFDQGKTMVKNFGLSRNDQFISADGIISANPNDELNIGFKHFDLQTLNPLTKTAGVRLKGVLNGRSGLKALLGKPRLNSGLRIDSLDFNNHFIGDLSLTADYDNDTKLATLNMDIDSKGIKSLDIHGTYDANPDQNNLDLDLNMDNTQLIILEPFIRNLVSNLTGTVSSRLKISGKPSNPKVDGTVSLNNAELTVNYLKTRYRINQKLAVNNTIIDVNDLRLKDVNNNEAIANGTVDLGNINTPTINVSLVTNKFMALNTTAKDNSAYYGTAFGTGIFSFDGPTDNMNINIDAKTEAGTVFNIPLNTTEKIGENDFIVFVGQDSSRAVKKENSFNGVKMNFSLAVDENSQVNIFTSLGKLSGRGKSDLSLRISTLGDFEMFGDYLISQGKFEFTAQDYINKVFDISQGGSIRWTGDPMAAVINLKANYGARTSLSPLYTAAGRPANESRVQAEAIMNLNGNLLKPDISFDLNFPTDSYVKDELQSYLSDINNVNQQALSLIVRRSFAPGNGTANIRTQLNSTVLSAGTEIAFNQLNNIITQSLNLNFVDFNIRSLNEASASIRLLNNRLVLSGGVTDRRAITDFDVLGSDVASDFEAQYLIKKDGSFVLRASNRLSNKNFLNPSQEYVTAFGLVYRKDFDNFNEFLRILIGKERKEERERQAERIRAAARQKN